MIEIDFAKIREFQGSQQNGFEELVCQIADIERPIRGKTFIRKDGSGGDGGVECYWILEDNKEYAWQAKYFLDTLSSTQWSQIDNSVKTAIEKHPNMIRYYICLPRDRNDSRKIVKGNPTKSELDRWNEHVEGWKDIANQHGRDIEFVFWGLHELIDILLKNSVDYTGKILYWFNTASLTIESLNQIANNSRICLGERYSEEQHIELPIEEAFSCIGMENSWKERVYEMLSIIFDLGYKLKRITENELLKQQESECNLVLEKYEMFSNQIFDFENNDYILFEYLEVLIKQISFLIDKCDAFQVFISRKTTINEDDKEKIRRLNSDLIHANKILSDVEDFLSSTSLKAGKIKSILITGSAGSGKSHLLCDVSLKRLENNYPTVFVLGQHYTGGSPINFIGKQLNLSGFSNNEILGALDTLGQLYKCRTLIVIDAINEGPYRDEWSEQLHLFIEQCKKYQNIGVVFSCRDTYIDFIISKTVAEEIPTLFHEGFRGFEHRAAHLYMSRNGITVPSVPFLAQEFSNPLFLKIACQSMKEKGIKEFPKGIMGFNQIFSYYIDAIGDIVRRKKKIMSKNIVLKAVDCFIRALYPDNIWGIGYDEALEIINKLDSGSPDYGTLLDVLITEGLFALEVISDSEGRKYEVVRFTYERFSDYAVAEYLLNDCDDISDLEKLFLPEGKIGKLLINGKYRFTGIFESLGIKIPEKYNKEFIEFIKFDDTSKDRIWEESWYIENTFLPGLKSRSGETITEKSLEYLNKLRGHSYHSEALDILISVSTEPSHPWNADFLDVNLRPKVLPERDLFWSTYVAVNDYYEGEETSNSPIRTLLNWVLDTDITKTDKERLRLTAIVFLWMTTTSNRLIRQQATKGLSKIFHIIPDTIVSFISEYSGVDDMYLVTSLYAAIYGAIVYIDDRSIISGIVSSIDCKMVIENEHPDILLRDYVRGIFEYAYNKGGIISNIEKYRPPYKSSWPLVIPLQDEIEKIDEEYSEIKNSVQGFIGDFGKYIMRNVKNWSATEMKFMEPKSCIELNYEFANKLPISLSEQYKLFLDNSIKEEQKRKVFDLSDFLKSMGKDELSELFRDDIDDLDESNEVLDDDSIENDIIHDESEIAKLIEDIINVLSVKEQDYFNWIQEIGFSDSIAEFSHAWSCRWVIKRAYELGWTKERFGEFERMYCKNYYGMSNGVIERIGKKYQWTAYHELLARLSDNLIFIDRGYSDLDDSCFYGPWQIDTREFDPTFWKKAKPDDLVKIKDVYWWQPCTFYEFPRQLDKQIEWLWDDKTLPNFESVISIVEPISSKPWIVLFDFQKWDQKAIKDKDTLGEPNIWYRINSCVIKADDLELMKQEVEGQGLYDPSTIYIPKSHSQLYLGEYPWHECYDGYIRDWNGNDEWEHNIQSSQYHVPLFEYSWSTGSHSHMPNESSNFYLPSRKIINELGLTRDITMPTKWHSKKGLCFWDPSIEYDCHPKGLISKEELCEWLRCNNYILVWLIGGEKQLFTHNVERFYGRLTYSAMYFMGGDGMITGKMWTEKQLPRE